MPEGGSKVNVVKVKDMIFADAYIQMFDLLDDCVMVVDAEGKIVLYNKASEKLDGLNRKNVIGKHLLECFKIERFHSSTLRALKSKKPQINVYQDYETVLGKRISSVSSSYPLVKDSEMVGVITITKDVTKIKEMLSIYHREDSKGAEKDEGNASYTFDDILGTSSLLRKSIGIAKMAAKTNSNVLIYGETGTGKELFAQSIHNASNVEGKFVSINCAAIPENLFESLLFGTVKGAFTGAVDQVGLFEEASNGTLFLDELNSMSLNMQSKLLRAIETGKIRRVGETAERVVNPRIISALNIHPLEAIEKGYLRRDLFYRLGAVVVDIPPLRDREGDIEVLTKEFINKYNRKFNKNVKGLSDEVMKIFKRYSWPGNVRELEHAIEHSMIVVDDNDIIEKDHIPSFIVEGCDYIREEKENNNIMERVIDEVKDRDLKSVLESVERMIITNTLKETKGNVAQAANKLGVNRQTLDYRIKKFNIRV